MIKYGDGTTYVGKGSGARSKVSAKQHAENKRTVVSLTWEAAATERQAFIDEYIKMCQYGGPNNQTVKNKMSHNMIWSPGRKYYYQDNGRYHESEIKIWQ